jgi:hypothetical protein
MPSFSDPRIVCRPALPSDTPDVLAFTRRIWDGRDYIHLGWEEWLADPQGLWCSAQFGPRIVGIAKVSPVFPGQWWLVGCASIDLGPQDIVCTTECLVAETWRRRSGNYDTQRAVHHLCGARDTPA